MSNETLAPAQNTRRPHTAQFKFKVVMESIEEDKMPSVARKYGVAYSLLAKWKRHFLATGHQVFETTPDKEKEQLHKTIGKLEQMIGKKEVELALIKNFSDFYASQNIP